jgi:acetate kinase
MSILTINGGSSSIRFALFDSGPEPTRRLQGKLERIGSEHASVSVSGELAAPAQFDIDAKEPRDAIAWLAKWLQARGASAVPRAVGHRVVHGMGHTQSERVTPELLRQLKSFTPYDPEHMPREIELIETLQRQYPQAAQVVCYDTAFHHDLPRAAQQFPIPRRFEAQGVRRYGFHGLSYTFLLEELKRLGDPSAASGRVVLAHLGSGASLAAVRDGRSVDTSMGFTPAGGLMMGTRSGDLDPGLLGFLARHESLSAAQIQRLLNHESGLLGVSETSADVRDLLQRELSDVRAREALELYCYQIKKWLGAYAAVLGGLDTLVFAGGVGENSPAVRARVCTGMAYLGIELDGARNEANAAVISVTGAAVRVRVIRTDEEAVIARDTWRVLQLNQQGAQ